LNLNRRAFLKSCGVTAAGSVLAGLGAGLYSTLLEPDWLSVEQISLPLQHLSSDLHGLRLAQLSDLHLEPVTDIQLIQTAMQKIAELAPDLIVLTGDFVYERAGAVEQMVPLLAALDPPLGKFACLGNHDYWTDNRLIRDGLQAAGVQVLVNSSRWIEAGRSGFMLAGIDDLWSGAPDLERTLQGVPGGQPLVLLAHEPDPADDLLQDSRIGLQLSGHTHGGQVRFPLVGAPVLPHMGSRYEAGLYRVNNAYLYVNRGLGVVPPGVRFNCRPEITLLTLQSPDVLAAG